jgi:spoIIIJ-associated protein
MTIDDQGFAEKKAKEFLETLFASAELNLDFEILACNGQVQPHSSEPAGAASPRFDAPATQPLPALTVNFTGPDTDLLTARNGELLLALEHIVAKILHLEPEEHHRISFDAEDFKANRDRDLLQSAEDAILQVRSNGKPYAFPTMTSRERRMLHLALAESGLPSASTGDAPRRFVVLYPENSQPTAPTPGQSNSRQSNPAQSNPGPSKSGPSTTDRTKAIRDSFRRR